MLSSDIAAAARPLYKFFRALAFTALLASHWIGATAAAPTLSGSPATSVTAAHYYVFQPSVSNPGGGTLTGQTVQTTGQGGIAVFGGLGIMGKGKGYQLKATVVSPSIGTGAFAISASFNVF